MSDEQKQIEDEELDKISGGVDSHPFPRDPIRPGGPSTHPGMGDTPVGGKRSNIAG